MVEKMLSHSVGRKMLVMSEAEATGEWVRRDKEDEGRSGRNGREKRGKVE